MTDEAKSSTVADLLNVLREFEGNEIVQVLGKVEIDGVDFAESLSEHHAIEGGHTFLVVDLINRASALEGDVPVSVTGRFVVGEDEIFF